MKDLSNYKHFVGCDVSKDTLDFALHERQKNYKAFEHIQVTNNIDGFRALCKWLKSLKVNIKGVVIGMEHTGLYSEAFAEWCFKQNITFVMLHASEVKNANTRGRNKTDREDAQFIADYVYTQREKLTASAPEPPVIKELRKLLAERKLAVNSRTAYKNQLKGIDDKKAVHRMKKMIAAFNEQVRLIETKIKELVRSDKSISRNYDLLESIPGLGIVNITATIVATSNFTRFQTGRQYAKFICVSPISHESGTSIRGGNHVVKAGHTGLKANLTQAAKNAVRKDVQLKLYFERKLNEGKTYGCVMNAIKFKLVCRIFAVIGRQSPYVDLQKYRV